MYKLGTAVILFNKKAEVLIGKRLVKAGNGLYSFPGGKVENDESPEIGAARELFEETNIIIDYKDLKKVTFTTSLGDEYGDKYVTLYYIAELPENQQVINVEPNKCEGWEWHKVFNMPKMWDDGEDIVISNVFSNNMPIGR